MTPKEYATRLINQFTNIIWESGGKVSKPMIIQCCLFQIQEMIKNELLTDLLQIPDDSPHKYKAIYQKMWLTDVKNELLKQQNNG